MNINQPSIWASIEFDCISRDFDYTQYKEMHLILKCKGAAVSQKIYEELQKVFHSSMSEFYSQQKANRINEVLTTLRSSTDRI